MNKNKYMYRKYRSSRCLVYIIKYNIKKYSA